MAGSENKNLIRQLTMEKKEGSQSAEFDFFAEQYDRALQEGLSATGEDKNYFATGRITWLSKRLASGCFSPKRILDFGCGTGTATPLLVEAFPGASVTGVDISARSLEIARESYRALPADFIELQDFSSGSGYDLAFSNGTFHHIPLAERLGAVTLIRKALRAGGKFALFENNPWNPGTRYVMSKIPFDRDAITLPPPETSNLLVAGGFHRPNLDFLFFFPHFLGALRPFEQYLCKLPLGGQYLALAECPE